VLRWRHLHMLSQLADLVDVLLLRLSHYALEEAGAALSAACCLPRLSGNVLECRAQQAHISIADRATMGLRGELRCWRQ
jgi:hypothetical protein